MAAVMYDSAWPTSAEALRLCRALGNDYADALPPRLWAWGIETDNEKGVFEADPKQLARIVRFDGDFDQLLAAFIACQVIEPTGKPHEYRIRGWKRNARLFRERKRLRNLRKNAKRTRTGTQTKPVREQVQNALSSSSSPSPSGSKDPGGDPETPPPIETLRDAQVAGTATADGRKVFDHWQSELQRVRGVAPVLMPPPAAVENGKRVLVNAAGDMEIAFAVVTAFVESNHQFWQEKRWPLWVLADYRDFERARLSAKTLAVIDDPEPKPWANDGKDWAAWRERQDAKGGKR